MIPDVTPNGVFYLPPTGWLTSFYNPPFILADLSPKYEKGIILDANHNFYAYLGDRAVYIFGLFID